jgi:OTU domain-containing protein 6
VLPAYPYLPDCALPQPKDRGPSKAAKKRAAKAAKEKEDARAQVLEAAAARREEKEGGGSRAESETAALAVQLRSLGKLVHEVPADGDCLYLAVAHQLKIRGEQRRVSSGDGNLGARDIRSAVAHRLRSRRADFEPFMELGGLEGSGDQFEIYCSRLTGTSEWGGHIELQALAQLTALPILVHEAAKAPIKIESGTEAAAGQEEPEPIQLSYHRHAYSLGEHYNSVVSA